jgi:hypothetical protein
MAVYRSCLEEQGPEPENARLPLRHAVATDRRDASDRRGHGDRSDIDGFAEDYTAPGNGHFLADLDPQDWSCSVTR